MLLKFDLAIIGGGPAGYVAAIRAAQLGSNVVLLEKDDVGGVCLNRGCIPTKTLWEKAKLIHKLKKYVALGVEISSWSINTKDVFKDLNFVVSTLRKGIHTLLRGHDVKVIKGVASFKEHNKIKIYVNNKNVDYIDANNILIATGSTPIKLDIPGIEGKNVYVSDDIFTLEELPSSVTIIGGGAVGVELASIFNEFNIDVTIVEIMPTILPGYDIDISKYMQKILSEAGVKIYTNTKVNKITDTNDGRKEIVLSRSDNNRIYSDIVIVSIGRLPNIDDLNLDNIGVEYDRKGIYIDSHMKTSVPNIYAAGDVTGKIMLAHAASHGGIVAVESITGIRSEMHYDAVPKCIFTIPEIASVGLTENEAIEKGYDVMVGRFPLTASGRAWTMHETRGFIKTIVDGKSKRVLGVHILGPEASELIAEATLIVNKQLTINEVKEVIHAHPTISEALWESILDSENNAIHKLSKKKR